MSTSANSRHVMDLFESAKRSFRNKITDSGLHSELFATTTVQEVYALTARLQEDPSSAARHGYLARIRRFLDDLSEFVVVIDVFVQIKADILAPIWGPIRLIILLSNQHKAALNAIADATMEIGQALPHFASMATTFTQNPAVQEAAVLFYQDILDFYVAVLRMFHKKRWKQLFYSYWPTRKLEIDGIVSILRGHAGLMKDEVTFQDIKLAQEAREQALAHYAKNHDFQETQKFLGLKSRIDPPDFDERLDWLCNRSHIDGAKWLFRDQKFNDWLDITKGDSIWLWLQGIPGAGKTYLAAAVISHAQKKYPVIFVLANHTEQKKLTALSVIQSMIFQIAADNVDLQAVLVESSERDLKSFTSRATELLKTLLLASGPTYMVIDGLDEIEEGERQILLQQLDIVLKDCSELKMLICSQLMNDITDALCNKAESLRVDQSNLGSIQAYINTRLQEWIGSLELDTATQSSIIGILAPLSARANGMFLYARIALDHLVQLHLVPEIEAAMHNLPTDLPDAYHRIYQRICSFSDSRRAKCQKILAWMACAPVPLTTLELEQAILIDPSVGEPQLMMVPPKFVEMCGPIIEVVNGRPQFVHFTAKEYFFNEEAQVLIDMDQANYLMAQTSLTYFCTKPLDLDLSDANLERNIKAGKYRLLGYLAFHWPALVLPSARQRDSGASGLLVQVAEDAMNFEFEGDTSPLEGAFHNESLQSTSPRAYQMLCATFRFHMDKGSADWNLSNSETWVNLDPLTVSQMLVRVQKRVETMICDRENHGSDCGSPCAQLQQHYGLRLYKCSYPFCEYNRVGFLSSADRELHVKYHENTWKCSVGTCEWSAIGFSNKAGRDRHWVKFHKTTSGGAQAYGFASLDGDEIQPILFGLVTDGDVDGVQSLLASSGAAELAPAVLMAACTMALQQGSLPVAQILFPEDGDKIPVNAVIAVLKGGDIDIVRWALKNFNPADVGELLPTVLGASSDDIYELWEGHFVTTATAYPSTITYPTELSDLDPMTNIAFKPRLIRLVKDDPIKEARLRHTWRAICDDRCDITVDHLVLSAALVDVAKWTCSVSLAKELIGLGANVAYYGKTRRPHLSALRWAAKETTEAAAHLMEFLLSYGAHVNEHDDSYNPIRGMPGPMGISRYLGVTWDELVERYQP